ncbi:MAG: hypothetical protein ACRD0V_01870 [Acidimicrobiales bacterium]
MTTTDTDSMAKARGEMMRRAAERAVDDPRQLARAARIVRAALARKALEPADLIEEVGPDAA